MERLLSQLLRVGDLWIRHVGHERHAPQCRKQARDEARLLAEQDRRLDAIETREPATERVHDLIERLVPKLLALVTAPAKNQRAGAGLELSREVLDERALADAGFTFDDHGHGVTERHRVPRVFEGGELGATPDEQRISCGVRARLERPRLGARARIEICEHASRFRPLRRVAAQQRHAQPIEIRGHRRASRARRHRLVAQLLGEDLQRGSFERQLPDQDLVEDDPDAVPIRRRTGPLGRRLFGRHVRGRPDQVAIDRVVALVDVRDEPEVEDHDATRRRHADVRRFQIAVHHPRVVERRHAKRELPQPVAQLPVVVARRCPERGGFVGLRRHAPRTRNPPRGRAPW